MAGIMVPFGNIFAYRKDEENESIWLELLDYARWSPSPHNVQPWKIKIISPVEAHLYYDPSRVPIVVDNTSAFTIVGMAMFIECMRITALAKGYVIDAIHDKEPRLNPEGKELRFFAKLHLRQTDKKKDLDPQLIKERRTSRLQYDGKKVSPVIINKLSAIAAEYGHTFTCTADNNLVHDIVNLNNETELKRADEKPTMNEMSRWIRTTDKEAEEKKDGLWYRCLDVSGKMLHNFIYHHQRFRSGWKRMLTKKMLDKSMHGTANMAWITGPFRNRNDWVQAGAMLQRMWLTMTANNIYMHPLGTVVTTSYAKEELLKRISYNESKGELWFLIRIGHSNEPQKSYRLDVKDILIA